VNPESEDENVGAPEEDAAALTARQIRQRLEAHSHFHGWATFIDVEVHGGNVVVCGRVPSFYLKQLLQEAVKATPGITGVENRVEVV
jgi:osmotically-inducible protein OsmY